ncbi:MAG: helix-turn-helix transcriptional regulator [Clostridia bacterium]|nr:helix-turn-helix transcriptional regulator [Clostridia bacterium]
MSFEVDYGALGARIRTARENRHLTQEQLSEICSLSAAHIGHIERGTRTPSVEALCAISSALGVSLDSLLLDSFDGADRLSHLTAALRTKDPEKVRRFVTMVSAMAEKIDEM